MVNIGKALAGLGKLFTCADMGEYLQITTPYLYPDGDCISLFCEPKEEGIMVTDLAETTRWLRVQSGLERRSPEQQRLIEEICQTHRVKFLRGMLYAYCRSDDSLADIVIRVAQAALRVSDLWLITCFQATKSAGASDPKILWGSQIGDETIEEIMAALDRMRQKDSEG